MTDFDPRNYWEQTLGANFDVRGVGYGSLGLQYNIWLYRLRKVIFRRLLRVARIDAKSARVLDVGCGTGFYIDRWQQAGVRALTGLDLTETSVQQLRRKFPDVTFVQGDIGDRPSPLAAQQFSVVDAFDVLFHIVDDDKYAQAFVNLFDALEPGGTLLFSDNFVHHQPLRGRHHVSRPLADTAAAVEAAGFTIEQRIPMFVLMNQPVDSRTQWGPKLWDRTVTLAAKHEALGWAIGAGLYPIDRLLTRLLRESPTTEIMICRKAG